MCNIDTSAESHQQFTHGIQLAALQELLTDGEIELICRQLGHTWRDRIFTPAVTVRSMVHRALNPDKSIRATLADLAAADHSLDHIPADASWCQARSRLPAEIWQWLLRYSIKRLQKYTSGRYLYKQRRVYFVDGSTLSMPDTPELGGYFGYAGSRKGPSRFPIARLTLVALSGVDCICDYRLNDYRTSEDAQFHQMWGQITSGSICIFDRLLSSFYNLAKLQQRGIDVIAPLHQQRDPHQLISQGKQIDANQWMIYLTIRNHKRKKYADPSLPEQLPVRLIRQEFLHHGKLKKAWLVTTLLNPNSNSQRDIEQLYRTRWGMETRIGELKTTLQMNILRSKGVPAVRHEVAATILAYNLLRTIIHQAAKQNEVSANRISFASAVKMILAYSFSLRSVDSAERRRTYAQMLSDIARCRNPIRPGRVEPRRIRRHTEVYPYLTMPRDLARKKCLS